MNRLDVQLMIPNNKTSLNYIVQAGYVLKSKKGTTLGVDLYLSDCVERFDGFKRLSPKVLDPTCQLDYILASHWHFDHFDIDAVPLLMSHEKTRLVCSKDCKKYTEALHLKNDRITYISEGDTLTCDDIIVHAVFCDHGDSAPLAVGFVFEVDGYKVYLAGDTCLRLDRAEEIAQYGPFDVMIAPINGAFGNLNESENVELCQYHRPKLSIPCHFWTFAEQGGDPGLWMNLMKEKIPNQKYAVLAPGEQLIIDDIE